MRRLKSVEVGEDCGVPRLLVAPIYSCQVLEWQTIAPATFHASNGAELLCIWKLCCNFGARDNHKLKG